MGFKIKRSQLTGILRFLMRQLTRTEYVGTENIPKEGKVIIATNHMSRLDIPVLYMNPVRTDLTALIADKYKEYPLFVFLIESAGGVWLDRSKADFSAFRDAITILEKGVAMGIAPEGTRSTSGQLLEGKPGTVLLALKTNAPIVPVGIAGTDEGVQQLKQLKRPKMTAHFGPAFSLPPLDRNNRAAELKRYADEIMCRIAVLLPEKYHGFYAGHPRLNELMHEQGCAA